MHLSTEGIDDFRNLQKHRESISGCCKNSAPKKVGKFFREKKIIDKNRAKFDGRDRIFWVPFFQYLLLLLFPQTAIEGSQVQIIFLKNEKYVKISFIFAGTPSLN